MPGSTMATAKLADAAGVTSQNAVVANGEPYYTGQVSSVVPDLVSVDVLTTSSQNLVAANETATPVGVTGD